MDLTRHNNKLLKYGGKLIVGVPKAVGHWKLNDDTTSAVVTDSSGNEDGTLYGSVPYFSNYAALSSANTSNASATGKLSKAFDSHDGTSHYGTIIDGSGSLNFDASSPYTVMLWFKADDWNGIDGYLYLYANDYFDTIASPQVLRGVWFFIRNTQSQNFIGMYNEGTQVAYEVEINKYGDTPQIIPDAALNNWHHVAWVYDGSSEAKLYLDGSLLDTFDYSSDPLVSCASDDRNYIAALNSHGLNSVEIIYFASDNASTYLTTDNVMVCKEELTAEGVAAFYEDGNGTETGKYN